MGGKGGGSSSNPYQTEFSGPEFAKTSPEMDKLQGELNKRRAEADADWAGGKRPPEATPAAPKDPVPKIYTEFPSAGAPPPMPQNIDVTKQYPAGNLSGLGDQLINGLAGNKAFTGQV